MGDNKNFFFFLCLISDFGPIFRGHEVQEESLDFSTLEDETIGCPVASAQNYHSRLRNAPEERRHFFRLFRGAMGLQLRIIIERQTIMSGSIGKDTRKRCNSCLEELRKNNTNLSR
jgi:hypothetical protein